MKRQKSAKKSDLSCIVKKFRSHHQTLENQSKLFNEFVASAGGNLDALTYDSEINEFAALGEVLETPVELVVDTVEVVLPIGEAIRIEEVVVEAIETVILSFGEKR